jgi:hypothetical protein
MMIHWKYDANIRKSLIVCVTVTKNFPGNFHEFHSEEKGKAKGPEVVRSVDISELV